MSEIAASAETATPGREVASGRLLLVFADGTGNAFSQRETNVWRLYRDLDKQADNQLARYLPGVGTSSVSVIRWLDAATGFGVPANVRKLYRFLCWNWRPGDRILLIGFSRGAFTVRTLAGLIAHQGLMPRQVGSRPVETAEMRRNAKGAWRAYRAASVPRRGPVRLWRAIGQGCVTLKRRLLGQALHRNVASQLPDERAPVLRWKPENEAIAFADHEPTRGIKVAFLGVFETVEAFGLPVEELRRPIGVLFFPLKFDNRLCAASVQRASHALAVDEERQTFAPVRFDQSSRKWQRIRELWFPGVHSDIGGGYPDDHNSVAPLLWMKREMTDQGVRFLAGDEGAVASRTFPRAPIHNSRSGFGMAYRYQPREIAQADQADPVLKAKINEGLDGYAPISLPDGCRIAGAAPLAPMKAKVAAAVRALIFRRRLMNRLLVLVLLFFVLSPWLFLPVSEGIGLQAILELGWKGWWLRGIGNSGWFGVAAALLGGLAWWRNLNLEEHIHDVAAGGWRDGGTEPKAPSRLGARMGALKPEWLDGLFIMAITVMAGTVLVQNQDRIARAFWAPAHCVAVGAAPALASVQEIDPAAPCVPIADVRAGITYGIGLEQTKPFVDWYIPAPVEGFASTGMLQGWTERWRRAPDALWFAPLAQIGRDGTPQPLAVEGAAALPATCLPEQPFMARFTADRDGPLFFFVNDIGILPAVFYRNNHGQARLVVCQLSQ